MSFISVFSCLCVSVCFIPRNDVLCASHVLRMHDVQDCVCARSRACMRACMHIIRQNQKCKTVAPVYVHVTMLQARIRLRRPHCAYWRIAEDGSGYVGIVDLARLPAKKRVGQAVALGEGNWRRRCDQ